MKILFFLINLILCIICKEFFLKAGTKTEGYCKEGDFIFSYENSFYLNNKFPKEDYDFKLLMENNIISTCKTKKRNLSNKFEIICKIKKYSGCYNFYFNTPKLGNLEPEKKILKKGDIIFFEGFKENKIIKKEKKDNKLSETVEIELNPGVIAKEIENFDAINNKKQFYIRDNIFSEEVSIDFLDKVDNFNIKVKVDDQENEIVSDCFFAINEKGKEIRKANIICEYPEELEDEPKTINITHVDPPTNIQFKGFSDIIFYTVTLGKLEKGFLNSNNYFFYLKNIHISKTLSKTQYISLLVSINEEEKESLCSIEKKKNDFRMNCIIQKYSPPESYNIYYNKQNYFYFSLTEKNSFSFETNNQDISTSTLKAGYILKDSCINGIYTFLIGGNILSGKLSQAIKGNFPLKLNNFNNSANCEIIGNQYNTIKCELYVEDNEDYCNNLYYDIEIEKLLVNYIVIGENEDILYLEGFINLQTYTVEGGDLLKGACNKDNIFEFQFINSISYNNITKDIEFPIKIKAIKNDASLNANCNIPENFKEKVNITCKIKPVESGVCPIMPPDKDLVIINNPGYITINSKVINFQNFAGKTTIVKVKAGNLSYNNKEYILLFSGCFIDEFLDNYTFKIEYEFYGSQGHSTNCTVVNSETIKCTMEKIESDNANIIINKDPKDDYEFLYKKTIVFEGFKDKAIYTFVAGKLNKGKCNNENNYEFSFINSSLPISYMFSKPIILRMEKPNRLAVCVINYSMNDIYNNKSLYNVDCFIEGINTCPVSEDTDIAVGEEEPSYLRIDEDENKIIYFYSFANKSSKEYSLSVGNLLKIGKEDNSCKYNFNFSEVSFEQELSIDAYISFSFDINFNEQKSKANCKIHNMTSECYIDLKEKECNSEEISTYELEIEDEVHIEMIDCLYNIKINGLNGLKTATISAGNIIEKENAYFNLENNLHKGFLEDVYFNLTLVIEGNEKNIIANCNIKENSEKSAIKCEITDDLLNKNSDIIIKTSPEYLLKGNLTIYFDKFIGLRTFTIKAGQVQKYSCKEGQDYQFRIINTISSPNIPVEKSINISIEINSDINGTINTTAICILQKLDKYNMNCRIENVNCVNNIKLSDDIITRDIFGANTTFFQEFNNRRTITIKAGKLVKGKLYSPLTDETEYYFTFNNNQLSEEIDKDINFILKFKSKEISEEEANCILNLSPENIITCTISGKLSEDDDIKIISDPSPNYGIFYPNSLYFINFVNQKTTTIRMKEEGMIIKGQIRGNNLSFIITHNTINDKNNLDRLINFEIEVLKGKDVKEKAICNIVESKDIDNFNISCSISGISINEEIVIAENPAYQDYYFIGYKGKKTLTIEAGSIEKKEINSFYIVKNKYIVDIEEILQ